MCMFCVIQKWSRRVATMLPWLVIPLIGLWALSQLLPPPFRFEVTSPRLACVFVLLVTLFWYEILMPQLSAWRVRRNARLRERKRFEALELQKLKKTATRKCRNCLTPYRDQNPGGGKFMCSYCGHVSKRPVLDLPIPPGMGISNSGIIKELFGKSGKLLNGKHWSDNVSVCNQEWLENGNWVVNGSYLVKSAYHPGRKGGIGLFSGSEPCLGDKSYSGAYFFACKLMMSFLLSVRWLCRKIFRISSSEDSASDADRGAFSRRGENGSAGPESRGEKARRKAEEKRQARLEKEMLEEEERKQREEVARLVEERRKLRDEKIEAENRAKGISSLREKDSKREAERKRQEKRREKDKGSSKSNSDVEELDKRSGRETERKRDSEKKSETDRRESPKTGFDSSKGYGADTGHGSKGNYANNFNRGHVGARYFDRMRGTFLSSSKAFTSGGFFSKATPTSVPASREVKPSSAVDYSSVSNSRRDLHPPERLSGKPIVNGDDKSNIYQGNVDTLPKTAPRSWQQLFTRSSAPPASSQSNVIGRPSGKSQLDVQHSQPAYSVSSPPLYDNPINFPSPFVLPPFSSGPMANNASLPSMKDPLFPSMTEMHHDRLPDEPELFEDPCYEPDPVSLLGPVSESLDNFQLDRGNSFGSFELGKSYPRINVSTPLEVSRPSPIESPMSRLRVTDEKQNNSSHFPSSPKATDMYSFPTADMSNINDTGTWQMWNSSPLGPDGLSLVGGPASWIAPLEQSRLSTDHIIHHSPQRTMASLFTKEGLAASGAHSQNFFFDSAPNNCAFGSSIGSSNDKNPWLQNGSFPPLSVGDSHTPIKPGDEASQTNLVYGSPGRSAANHAFDPSTASCWSKNDWAVQGSGEVRSPPAAKSSVGGLYSTSDVQSFWSFQ